MNQPETQNGNINNMPSLGSSPVPYESAILATKEKPLKYPFAKPVKTNFTNAFKNDAKSHYNREFSLFSIQSKFPSYNLVNSGLKATENDSSQNDNKIIFKISQPEQPTLILKEYNIYQNFLKATTNSNIHQSQFENLDEKDTVIRSKSGEVQVRSSENLSKKKTGTKRKLMEPVRLHSSRHKFSNRPYVPYEEIVGYADDEPYDHFGFREERIKAENENPNDKIIELMNKIQKISQHSYSEKEEEIAQKFKRVENNPIEILVINQANLIRNREKVKKMPSIQFNKDMFQSVILPAPIIKTPPDHIFLRKILNNEIDTSKKIMHSTSKLMMCKKLLKAFKKTSIFKYTTFTLLATEIWPRIYKETKEDQYPEKVDVINMIDKYHQLFASMEEIELNYYSELLHINYNHNSLVYFNYDPKKLFD